ncbi:hypothetical protein ACOSQ2_014870 [Xanthoceras sorbifolium]
MNLWPTGIFRPLSKEEEIGGVEVPPVEVLGLDVQEGVGSISRKGSLKLRGSVLVGNTEELCDGHLGVKKADMVVEIADSKSRHWKRRAQDRLDRDSIMVPDGVRGNRTGLELSEGVATSEKIRQMDTERLGNDQTFEALLSHVKDTLPGLVFLMEAKLDHHQMERIRVKLDFSGKLLVDCVGQSGGQCLFWSANVIADLLSFSLFHIYVKRSDHQPILLWVASFVTSKGCLNHRYGRRFLFKDSWADAKGCRQIVEEVWSARQVANWQVVDIKGCISTCAQRLKAWNEMNLHNLRHDISDCRRILSDITRGTTMGPWHLIAGEDSLQWHHMKDGEYTVKSGYFASFSSGSVSCNSDGKAVKSWWVGEKSSRCAGGMSVVQEGGRIYPSCTVGVFFVEAVAAW